MKRILYVDYMRFLAIVGVLFLHITSNYITNTLIFGNYWIQSIFISSLTRFSIILFIMISGLLLLKKDNPINTIPRRIKRILEPFIVWFIIYFIVKWSLGLFESNTNNFLVLFINAILDPTIVSVQFWFVYMIIALYIATPLVSKLVHTLTDREIEYFLGIWFVCLVLKFIDKNILILDFMGFFMGHMGYFILGYYLSNTKRYCFNNRKFAICLIVIGTLITFMGTLYLTSLSNSLDLKFLTLGDLTPGAAIQAAGIFILIKNTDFREIYGKYSEIINNHIILFSKLSYGMYLSNVLLINLCSKIGIFSLDIPPFINVPIMVIMLIVILSVMLLVMNKIPIIKKATGLNNNLNKG